MFKNYFIILFLLVTHFSFGNEIYIKNSKYEEARKSTSFIKFESTSTKLGFITTAFDGFVKTFKVTYDLNKENLSNLSVDLLVNDIDTDNSSRDEKMHNEILDAKNFPSIHVTFNEAIALTEGEKVTTAIFKIKDVKVNKSVKYSIKKINDKFIVSGTTSIGLKEATLPDPSISIAKVRDNFDLSFSISI